MKHQKTHLLVLQSTSFCNIDCSYCYLPGKNKKDQMPLEQIEQIFARLYSFPSMIGNITILWHAGEPCVLPASYYQQAITIIESRRPKWITYNYSILTNGTLLDESWIPLLRRADFHVGVSIDGPKHVHDSRRKGRTGKGTFDATMNGINLLRKHDIEFYVISVLSRAHLTDWDTYADFYIENGISSVGFNIDELEGQHSSSSFSDRDASSDYKSFLRGFVLRASQSDGKIAKIRELYSAFTRLKFAAPSGTPVLNEQAEPFAIISIAANGDVSTFSPELLTATHPKYGDFRFGNILRDDYNDLLNSEKFKSVHAAISMGVNQCKENCGYFKVCGGGAPSNKLFENGDFASTETVFCNITQKAVFDVALEITESMVESEAV